MKTYIYQDEKSHKFWAVEQQENELHITWGKVGTNGQSQVKSFADAAAAEKAELKLIAEKVKKGYVEHGASTELQMPNDILQNDSVSSELYSETVFSPVKTSADSLPWLQENSPIILDEPYRSNAFSSRKFPGEKISIVSGPDSFLEFIWQQNTCPTEFRTILSYFDVNACNAEWKNALNETIIRAEQGIEEGSLLADVFLIIACPVFRISLKQEILLDYIVQHKGLEYAVDIILALMQIQIDIEDRGIDEDLIFHFSHLITQQRFEYGIGPLEFQLRKHLSHAEEKIWLCCINKLIEALPGIAPRRQPVIAMLLLESPEIANQIALSFSHLDFPELEWLNIFVTDPQAISLLEKFNHWKLFESYSFGESCIATLLQEQGISGLSRLSAWADHYRVLDALLQINHPYSLELVIRKTDRVHQLESLIQKFPEAMLAALCAIVCQDSRPLYETLIQGIALSDMSVVRRTFPHLTPTAQEVLTGCLHKWGLNLEIDPAVPDWQPHTNHILALLSQEKRSYYDDDPLLYSENHPEATFSALTQLCMKGKNTFFLKQLNQLILTHGKAVHNFLEWCSETQKQFIYSHFPQLFTKSEIAEPNEIPNILVSPPWFIKEDVSLPVLKLDILQLSPVVNTSSALKTTCTLSTAELLEHLGLRYTHRNNIEKNFPEEIGNDWDKGKYSG
ncbi:molybdate metabolism regulator [Escherichia coli]|nr:WGR domain-containing protein [Escherichia coli]CTT11743.1 molybdate metabolism regulator [Escherichia coli]